MSWPLRTNQLEVGTITHPGGDEIGHLGVKGRSSASRDSLTHLGKASENMDCLS